MDYDSLTKIITRSRISTLTKKGIIAKTSYQGNSSKTKNEYTYKLTKKGMKFCRSKGMKHFEKGKGNERHQTEVGKKYASLCPEEQLHCKNQFDQKELLYDQAYLLQEQGYKDEYEQLLSDIQHASYLDLVYTTTIENKITTVGFEVITRNYSYEDCLIHEETALEILHCDYYETINIH